MSTPICRLEDIPVGSSKGFSLGVPANPADFFIVRMSEEHLYAYRNNCPHTGMPLEWQPDQFLDLTGRYIVCGIHGALFRPEDGVCISGPCVRRRLQALALEVRDGWVSLSDQALSAV